MLLLLGSTLLLGAVDVSKPIILSPAEGAREGRTLSAEIISQRPAQNTSSSGFLRRKQTVTPVNFEIQVGEATWRSVYEAVGVTNGLTKLTVIRTDGRPNEYRVVENGKERTLTGNHTMTSFAGSDFWVADLGLEFLFWPEQRVLRKEIRRGQSCSVLESINPAPAKGAYARVVSWVDLDTNGIINADAYDSNGKPMKEFAAKAVKKVRGQWELKEIEMTDRKTGTRTTLEFDLGTK